MKAHKLKQVPQMIHQDYYPTMAEYEIFPTLRDRIQYFKDNSLLFELNDDFVKLLASSSDSQTIGEVLRTDKNRMYKEDSQIIEELAISKISVEQLVERVIQVGEKIKPHHEWTVVGYSGDTVTTMKRITTSLGTKKLQVHTGFFSGNPQYRHILSAVGL